MLGFRKLTKDNITNMNLKVNNKYNWSNTDKHLGLGIN